MILEINAATKNFWEHSGRKGDKQESKGCWVASFACCFAMSSKETQLDTVIYT